MNWLDSLNYYWTQTLTISPEKVEAMSGCPSSWGFTFMSCFMMLAAILQLVPAANGGYDWLQYSVCVLFLIQVPFYAAGRHVVVDLQDRAVAFTRSFFDVPIYKKTYHLLHIGNQEGISFSGFWRSFNVIQANTNEGEQVHLYFAPAKGFVSFSYEEYWDELKRDVPESLLASDEAVDA